VANLRQIRAKIAELQKQIDDRIEEWGPDNKQILVWQEEIDHLEINLEHLGIESVMSCSA
jgi:peptidoglycan hydrolase CwlO-like protein